MTASVRLVVTTGSGFVAKRHDAVLFATTTTWGGWSDALVRFVDAPDAASAVESFQGEVIAARFAIDPYVIVVWAQGPLVIAFGDVDVTSDLADLPMLSGRGSSTWVERRLTVPPGGCHLRAGATVTGPSRLSGGIVPGDGIELRFDLETADGTSQSFQPALEAQARVTSVARADSQDAAHRADRWAALKDAAGSDRMDDSLGLDPVDRVVNEADADAARHTDDAESEPATAEAESRNSGPPPVPVFDLELTLDPRAVSAVHQPEPARPMPTATPPRAPVLGRLVLPDGAKVAIRGAIVLGRDPDGGAARVDGHAAFCRLDVGADVSRTHLVVRANGPTIEAIDCGSSGHTVLVSSGNDDPLMLEPWVPYELNVGDTLYLGGPTQVRIDA